MRRQPDGKGLLAGNGQNFTESKDALTIGWGGGEKKFVLGPESIEDPMPCWLEDLSYLRR